MVSRNALVLLTCCRVVGSQRWRIATLLLFSLTVVLRIATPSTAASVREAEQLFRRGEYRPCYAMVKREVDRGTWNQHWPRLMIRLALETGRYDEARKTYEAALERFPRSLPLRLLGHDVYRFNNLPARAEQEIDRVFELVESRPRSFSSAENLTALGRCALLRGADPRQVLELFYDRVRESQPDFVDVYLATAELAVRKHDHELAAEVLRQAAQLRDDEPAIPYLLARAWADSDSARAAASLRRALELNPHPVDSLLLTADRLIDAERYEEAKESLTRVLEVNVRHPAAWAYHAVISQLLGESVSAEALRETALSPWRTNPQVDYLIGKKLSQKYLFHEAALHQRRALAFDKNFLPAKFQLAQDLLRLAKDDEGWQLADEVNRADPYNVVAHNLVELHDRIGQFATFERGQLIVRMDASEARIYGKRVLDLLAAAQESLCPKYNVTLDKRVVVELFPRQEDFAIRTFGLPGGAGYLGVCFGRVITANSPASQGSSPSNWQAVLWHEFCHVVTLQKTNNRMPRWLSEGISVYEERQRNSAWGQVMTPAYREMILGDDLTPVSRLSGAFLAPASPQHLQFAYFESSLVVQYLIEKHGFPTLLKILDALGEGLTIVDALQQNVGSMARIDQGFAEYAQARARGLSPELDFDRGELPRSGSPDVWSDFLASHPNNYWGLRKHAQALIDDERFKEALQPLEQLRGRYPSDATAGNAWSMLARVYRELDDTPAERSALVALADLDGDAVSTYLRLMELASADDDWSAVADYAQRMLHVDPLRHEGHEMLARAAEKRGDHRQLVAALEALAVMDPIDPANLRYRLARAWHHLDRPAVAKRQVLMALEEAPRYRQAQRLLLEMVDAYDGNRPQGGD